MPTINPFKLDLRFIDTWRSIGESISGAIEWFKNIQANSAEFSIKLLTWIYEFLTNIVLVTPSVIFNNTGVINLSATLSIASVSIVTILATIESIKQMLNVRHTKFENIVRKFPMAVIGAGIAPFLFEQVFLLLNKLSRAITNLNKTQIENLGNITASKLSGLDTMVMLGFDIILIGLLIPIILACGRRWFDLLLLCCLTPLALTAWLFDQYEYLFRKWWQSIKALSMVQIIYAIFICIIGLLIFGIKDYRTPQELLIKMLLIFGGLWRMANPPTIVTSHADRGGDILDMGKDIKDIFTLEHIRKPFRNVKRKIFNAFTK